MVGDSSLQHIPSPPAPPSLPTGTAGEDRVGRGCWEQSRRPLRTAASPGSTSTRHGEQMAQEGANGSTPQQVPLPVQPTNPPAPHQGPNTHTLGNQKQR